MRLFLYLNLIKAFAVICLCGFAAACIIAGVWLGGSNLFSDQVLQGMFFKIHEWEQQFVW